MTNQQTQNYTINLTKKQAVNFVNITQNATDVKHFIYGNDLVVHYENSENSGKLILENCIKYNN